MEDHFGQAMAWAEDETDPISNASMKAEFGETTPEQRQYQTWNQKMHNFTLFSKPFARKRHSRS